MILVSLNRTAEAFHFDAADDVGHLAFVEEGFVGLLNESEKLIQADNARAGIGFEFCWTGEDSDAVKSGVGKLEE